MYKYDTKTNQLTRLVIWYGKIKKRCRYNYFLDIKLSPLCRGPKPKIKKPYLAKILLSEYINFTLKSLQILDILMRFHGYITDVMETKLTWSLLVGRVGISIFLYI